MIHFNANGQQPANECDEASLITGSSSPYSAVRGVIKSSEINNIRKVHIEDRIQSDLGGDRDDNVLRKDHALLRSVALSEGLHNHGQEGRSKGYLPLYHHPLPVSHSRFVHEETLRAVLSCKESFQAMAAITRGDAWTLEEVYMRGGSRVMEGKNGSSPIHLAVQRKSLDAIMVLINIGVDLNEVNSMGFTPLFIAHSSGATEIEQLLIENGAKIAVDRSNDAPLSTILDVKLNRLSVKIRSNKSSYLNQPNGHTLF